MASNPSRFPVAKSPARIALGIKSDDWARALQDATRVDTGPDEGYRTLREICDILHKDERATRRFMVKMHDSNRLMVKHVPRMGIDGRCMAVPAYKLKEG
jgi:hypothetical protein